jgi:hypothetical protein
MASLCVTLFLGTTLLAHAYAITPAHDETVVSLLARTVFGGRGSFYYCVQAATMLILVLAANPALVLHFRSIRRHYDTVASELTLRDRTPGRDRRNTVIVPVSGVHKAVLGALQYAKGLSSDVRAVYVETDPAATEAIRLDWRRWGEGVPLTVLRSPYRSLMEPLLDYVEEVDAERPDNFVTVVLPEFVPSRWWHHLLHNQRALLLKAALLFRANTVVISVPFHLRV